MAETPTIPTMSNVDFLDLHWVVLKLASLQAENEILARMVATGGGPPVDPAEIAERLPGVLKRWSAENDIPPAILAIVR